MHRINSSVHVWAACAFICHAGGTGMITTTRPILALPPAELQIAEAADPLGSCAVPRSTVVGTLRSRELPPTPAAFL